MAAWIQSALLALALPASAAQDTLLTAIPGPLTGAQAGALLGSGVAINGGLTAVGAPDDDTGAPAAGVVKLFDSVTGELLHLIPNPSPGEGDYFGSAVSLSGTWLLVGAPQSTNAAEAGSAYLYDLSGETPQLAHTLNNPAAAAFDEFGFSVAISGSKLVVGAYRNDTGANNAGRAYVYDLNSGTPTIPVVTLENPTPVASDLFGRSVAISGNLVIVGAHQNDTGASNAGSAYVFDLDGPTPSSPTYVLSNPVPAAQDFFGIAVAISGTRVAVGASGEDTGAPNTGSTYFYDLAGLAPTTPLATINNPSPGDGDSFGRALAISGTRLVIGADSAKVGEINAGRAHVYDLTGGTPSLLHTLDNPSLAAGDLFGKSVAVTGSDIAIGAPNDDTGANNAGSAYVYDLEAITPTVPVAALNNPGPASGNRFGNAVAASGRWLVAAAPYDDSGASKAGIVHVFDLAGETPDQPLYTLFNPAPAANDTFGYSVAISGSRILVGAPFDDTGETNAGTVYVYDIGGGTPESPVLTLNNPIPQQDDYFGWSVSISGNLALVGVPYQDTGATDAGCAYVYDLGNETPTVPVATINNPSPAFNDRFGWATAICGERAVIGAYNDDTGATDAGSAYVYDLAGGSSTLLHTLNNPDAAESAFFGGSVAISGSQVLVAAPNSNFGATNAGSAYFYELSGATPELPVVTLNNPAPASNDFFGTSVAISESRVLIGVPNKDGSETDTGLAHVYDIHGATPSLPLATLENPNPTAGEFFGLMVAISGKTCAIGAPFDDSLLADTGSVFVFGPAAQIALERPSGCALRNNAPAIDAGALSVGDMGELLNFTIRNNGIVDIEGIAVAVEGLNASDFQLDAGTTATSLAPGASTTFTVKFAPTASGIRQANLSISSNNGDENPFIVPLAGTGLPSDPTPRDLFDAFVQAAGLAGADAEPDASPFNDGVSNLIKYAFNMDASGPDTTVLVPTSGTAGLPVLLYIGGSQPDVHYEFIRRKNSGLTYTPLQSTTLAAGSWEPMTGTITVTDIDGTWERVVILQEHDPELTPKRFFRMEVFMGDELVIDEDPVITVTVTPESVTEDGAETLVFTFTRNGMTSDGLTVSFLVSGTAVFGDDYSQSGAATFDESTGTVTFAAESGTATVTVSPISDIDPEADETVILTLAGGSAYVIGTPDSAIGTILNDDTESEPTPRELFDAYAQAAGLTGEDAEPNATPFNDGVSNLIKYASNMDASRPDTRVLVPTSGTAGLPVLLYIGGSQPDVRYEFIRRKNSGLTYTPLQSTTLAAGSWEPMTGTITVTDIDETWERVVILQEHDPVNTPKRFFRMEVVLADGPTPRDLFDAFVQAAGLAGADAEPDASPFNEGVSNLIKYAFNMDASGPDTTVLVPTTGTAGLPVLLYIGGSQPDVRYEFIRRKNSGLTYTPLQSTTLAAGSWEPMTGTITVTDIDETWERVVILQEHDPVNTPKRFFKMGVTLD